ncbi:hypothetical protein GUITHDRAFT_110906 [Guillardia theta CCMP2712]|uniref:dolichyl-phosphate-mannose--protein mannosyltransferase n=2 Tax=Guillardia theta TaxID=55529 RepID=L1J4Y0_GUITC|nr:hypothetical protein GUITHDRAFT_110906 [Guillardia theta CCMP2712]EKX43179.1 hypothetical protein GUITHDRAFT_110906 [Guillardia theta CCMP2712]|eukprot:XP_005830159.1 hypothetical protein GUITHDRAFT_110906 [Guillardia theta CCMP2712]
MSMPITAFLLLFFLAGSVYLNSLHGEFVFDDIIAVMENKDVLPSTPLEKVFKSDFWGTPMEEWQSHKSFRPLTILSFRLSYLLAGRRWDEVQFHSVNVVLHGIVTLLLYPVTRIVLGRRRRRSESFWACALFATHPIHTDAVSSIVSRGEMLSAIMFLLSFLCHVRSTTLPSRFVLVNLVLVLLWTCCSIALAFCGMLFKEQSITVFGVNVVYELVRDRSMLSLMLKRTEAKEKRDDAVQKAGEEEEEEEEKEDGDGREPKEEHAGNSGAAGSTDDSLPARHGQESGEGRGAGAGVQAGAGGAHEAGKLQEASLGVLRLVCILCSFLLIFQWRKELNGPCIPVFKLKGDPNISAWDAAGTVAPGVYSEAACRPNFLQVENPARFVRGERGWLVRLLTWNFLLYKNAELLMFPLVLKADYSHFTVPLIHDLHDARNLLTVLFWCSFLLLSSVAVLLFVRRKDISAIMSLSLIVAPFLPSSNLFFPVGFVIAERVLYAPSLGFCILLSLAIHRMGGREEEEEEEEEVKMKGGAEAGDRSVLMDLFRSRAQRICLFITVAYGIRTLIRNRDWRHREAFYGAMIRDNPTNPKAHYGYGNIIINDVKRIDIGVKHLLEASRLQPNYFDAYNDLGAFYNRAGQYEKAEEQLDNPVFAHTEIQQFAVKAKPEHINGLHNLGLNSLAKQDYEKAFLVFDQAVDFFPDRVDFYFNMGQALHGLGMHEDALQAHRDIISLDPLNPISYYWYGLAAGKVGRQEEAELFFRNAIRINRHFVDAMHNLGVCLMKQDRLEEAIGYFLRVRRYNPNHVEAKRLLSKYLQVDS